MPTSRYFGSVAPASETLDAQLVRGSDDVRIDVNLAEPAAFTQAELDAIDGVIDAIDRHDAAARAAFEVAMTDEDDEPLKFWQFHHEEVEEHGALERGDFVAALQLKRVGFYPDGAFGSESYLVLDYALRGPNTDQLLVAKFLRGGSLLEIAWES